MLAEHRRIDRGLAELRPMVADGRWRLVGPAFERLAELVFRHMAIEEKLIFPVFDERLRAFGPTRVMRGEHERIAAVLRDMGRAIECESAVDYAAAEWRLDRIQPHHGAKEEAVIYPAVDRALSPEERVALVRALVDFPRVRAPWPRPAAARAGGAPPPETGGGDKEEHHG
jgi:hemerythrin-like domain-containing protein